MGQRAGDVDRLDNVDELEDRAEGTEVEEARAQIEQTRAEMSGTIDAIKAKLDPPTLMQQAKETVTEVTATAAQKAKETVADVTQRAKETVHDVTADVVQQAKEALPTVTANAVSGAVTEAKEAVGSAVHTAKEAVGGAVDTAKDASSTLVEAIRRNPVPAVLIGISLGWLWMRARQERSAGYWEDGSHTTRYSETGTGQAWTQSGETESRDGRDYRTYGADTTATGGTVHHLREKVGEVTGQVQDKAAQFAGQVQDKAGQLVSQARGQVSELGSQAKYQMRQTGDWFQRTLNENPLAVGAMALGLGAAVGLLLPETPAENRWMGETRDRLADKAQTAAQDLKLKAQIVAEEALDTAAEEARKQGLTTPTSGGAATPASGADAV